MKDLMILGNKVAVNETPCHHYMHKSHLLIPLIASDEQALHSAFAKIIVHTCFAQFSPIGLRKYRLAYFVHSEK